jgi:hypothetical protein
MMQIYFLSVFSNILAGYTLISDNNRNTTEIRTGFSLQDETVKLILGILSIAAGILKLLSPAEGDFLILGDLFPAITGLSAGIILCSDFYKKHSTIEEKEGKKLSILNFLLQNRKVVGFAAIAAAIIHFLLPGIFFL